MSTLVVYDSVFGNTAQVAEAIAQELAASGEVTLRPVADARAEDLAGISLFVIGSPTRGFRPTPAIQEFLAGLPEHALAGVRAAAFDTRIDLETVHPAPLRWLVDVGGYAANVLESQLVERHCVKAADADGFVVTDAEGPLREGEVERARNWAKAVADSAMAAD